MRMKLTQLHFLFLSRWFGSILMMLISCSPEGPISGFPVPGLGSDIQDTPTNGTAFHVNTVPDADLTSILADTITPPSNPMAPIDIASYHSFIGEFSLSYYGSELYATINSNSSVYFLLDHSLHSLLRLDHKVFTPFAVGDTIIVTGQLYEINYSGRIGLTTYFLQPAQ